MIMTVSRDFKMTVDSLCVIYALKLHYRKSCAPLLAIQFQYRLLTSTCQVIGSLYAARWCLASAGEQGWAAGLGSLRLCVPTKELFAGEGELSVM